MQRQAFASAAVAGAIAGSLALGAATPAAAQFPAPPPSAPAGPRVIYTLDEIQAGAIPSVVLQQLSPLHTLAEVEPVLKKNNIPYVRAKNVLSSDVMDPAAAQQIAKVGKNDIFIVRQAGGWVIASVIARR